MPSEYRNAIAEPAAKLHPQPMTGRIGHRARQNLGGLGFADSGDECMSREDKIARTAGGPVRRRPCAHPMTPANVGLLSSRPAEA